MRVGIDDTDSPQGGCTTHFALVAAAAFRSEHGLVLRALPRLVRLNPNVPWKTRGNAAVALLLGEAGSNGGEIVGVAPDGTELTLVPSARPVRPLQAHLDTLERLRGLLCDPDAPGTDPAFVLVDEALDTRFYEEAVRGIVDPEATRRALEGQALFAAHGDGRGIVGAAAAVAYPAASSTFELIVYRDRARWGTQRQVDFASVDLMDRQFSTTYHNVDRRNRHIAISPSTPCPLLFGIRAVKPGELREAAASVDAGEPWGGWLLFETNQGTDAHVVEASIAAAQALVTVMVGGEVRAPPRRLRGGHVVFAIADATGAAMDCAAYEPTKEFRDIAGRLEPGDRVRVVGAIRADRRTLNLEKLEIVRTVPRPPPSANPPCGKCGRRMKSAGAGGPLRCRSCGAKQATPAGAPPPGGPAVGWYEVPICARRHLAKPIDPHGYPAPGE